MLPNLDIDILRTFIAIADTGSFTRAAAAVGRTQSAVSMQVRRLEELTGRALFLRDGRLNRLSPDGERMLEYARRTGSKSWSSMCAGSLCEGVSSHCDHRRAAPA